MTDEVKNRIYALRMCPVGSFRCEDCPVYIRGEVCQNELNAADLIESMAAELEQVKRERDAAVAAMPQWISVEERMPEPYHTYLVALKEKYSFETEWRYHVDVADMVDGDGYIEGMWNTFNDWYEGQEIHVTHWMPLPEAPKEE